MPLTATPDVRVYVGCEAEQDLAFRTLKHSILSHAPGLQVYAIHEELERQGVKVDWEMPRGMRRRTPFSFQRFAVPQLAGFEGMAIYLDSDMLLFGDIRRMLDHVAPEADLSAVTVRPNCGRRPQISVLVFDCARCNFTLDSVMQQLIAGQTSYDELFYKVPIAKAFRRTIPWTWNDLEYYEPNATQLVHFTDMDFQPWLTAENPLTDLWVNGLRAAIKAGDVSLAGVEAEIRKGNVRPSLGPQLRKGLCADQLSLADRLGDLTFVPPHRVGFTMRPAIKRPVARALGLGRQRPSLFNRTCRAGHGAAYRIVKQLRGSSLNKR